MAGKFDPRQHPRGGDPRNSGRFSDRDLPEPAPIDGSDFQKELVDVLESASRLQELVPDAVLVGGSAAALYAGHRLSYDHDHIVNDLQDRYDVVLDALEREGDWVTNRTRPGKIILGSLGDIEAGVRQLIRKRPLECREATLPSGRTLRVPTAAETLRIKGFLCVKRNQVRDYLDVAALADRYGIDNAATVLARIDDYYADEQRGDEAVATSGTRPRRLHADQRTRHLQGPRRPMARLEVRHTSARTPGRCDAGTTTERGVKPHARTHLP